MSNGIQKSIKLAEAPTITVCPSCGATSVSGASYCHACGTLLAEGAGERSRPSRKFAIAIAIIGLIAVSGVAVFEFSEREIEKTSSPPLAAPMPVAPPDLSRMTPREAADRLFNRIMTASEQGDHAQAIRFVPMAVQAYGVLPVLDGDAYYHLALIHEVAGDTSQTKRYIAALKNLAPDHLLALLLAHRIAEQSGDRATASKIQSAFAAAYESEMAHARPEYEAHRNTIDKFRAAIGAGGALFPTKVVGNPPVGAELFAKNCAGCHGRGAQGSDRGPPLVHKIYEPGHHGDGAFLRAVRDGVRPHHWSFGAMPSIPGVSDEDVKKIVTYIRGLQRDAGIN